MKSALTTRGTRTMARRFDRPWESARRGFSLIEMVVVLLIIGMLVGAVAVNVLGESDKAKIEITKRNLVQIKGAIDTYMIRENAPPPTLQVLVATKQLAEREFTDEWGRDFQYGIQANNPNRPFLLWSLGKDGLAGTEDDIDGWEANRKTPAGAQ